MEYIKRDIEQVITRVSQHYAAVIITGPRQAGKTTTLRHIAEGRIYVTLDNLDARRMAQNDPALFISMYPPPVLIDEVQYAPQLFSYIKIAADNGAAAGSYWLTGSQAFRLMELAQESLAGRVAILHMTSLSQHEMYGVGGNVPFLISLEAVKERVNNGTKTDVRGIYQRIWKGSMPGHVSGRYPDRDIFYASYLQSYIQRDIGEMVKRIDSLQFADFVRAAACRIGSVLNIHDIARDVGISDDTAKRWLLLMEQSGVVFFLRPYFNNLLKRVIKAPKMYFFDTGLVAYLTRYSSPEILINGALNGAILENYVVAEIAKSFTNNGKECLMYYYRDKDGKEIDLLLESDGAVYPIEIKKSTLPNEADVRGFDVLHGGNLSVGMGAVVCTSEVLSAINRDVLIVPAWMI
ncbi:MAG: ATP-binding protein [Defluviitaleaceae bacterium]|nr:ATP-binding protein [Defluviitaleaceae bacterium]MCL2275525.1 ATP-binding protein [Defluviitaleaceae bacterium]